MHEDNNPPRQNYIDGRKPPATIDLPSWVGFSAGHWEGDTLVVDTIGFNFLLYTIGRVDCPRCHAVVVEPVPWCDGQRTLTKAYMLFLARWARRLSWKEAEAFRTSWEKVFDAVEHVVAYGLEHRSLRQIDAIGVDEIQYAKGHKYLTLVYQIDLGVTRLKTAIPAFPPLSTRWRNSRGAGRPRRCGCRSWGR